MNRQVAVAVKILDKEFQIGCLLEEKEALKASAEYLNARMRQVRDSGVIGIDRIAVLAALNLTKELLQATEATKGYIHLEKELNDVRDKVLHALDDIVGD